MLAERVNLQVGVGLNPNSVRKAIVKSVRYEKPEWSTIGEEEIFLETEDGLTTQGAWFINHYCHVHGEEFCRTRDDILAGKITEGTEVTIEYNPNGIMCFYL